MNPKSENFNYSNSIQLLRRMLDLAGIWPTEKLTKIIVLKLFANCTLLLASIFCVGMELFNVVDDINKVIEVLVSLLQFIIVAVKFCSLILKKRKFLNILKDLKSPIFNAHEAKFNKPIERAAVKSNKIVKIFGMLTVTVIIFYALFPVIDQRSLPIPFGYNLGNYNYLMYFFQCMMLASAGLTGNSIDALYVTLMTFAAAEIEILCMKLLTCVKDSQRQHSSGNLNFNNFVRSRLIHCVELHTCITRFIGDIDKIFSFAILVQYIFDMVHICSLLIQLVFLIEPSSTQFGLAMAFLMAVIMQLSFYHWFGNEIITKSSRIGEFLYMSKWYLCNISNKRTMSVLLEKAKVPLAVTIYKFTSVSLASFVTIIRWAYSLFALLQTVMGNK